MADIRPNQLPDAVAFSNTDHVIVDQNVSGVRKADPVSFVNFVAPIASQSEAEAGADNTKRMTPLRTKQSIASEVGVTLASKSQGDKADTAVQTVNSKIGPNVTIDKSDVGLGDADNTSDMSKPVSTATQTALDGKVDNTSPRLMPSGGLLGQVLIKNSSTDFDVLWGTPGLIDADVIITVGSGGDYSTINAALEEASTYSARKYVNNGFTVEVKLLAGFVMAEQVIVRNGIDLSFVVITGEDVETTITRSALTTEIYPGNYAAFAAANGSSLPQLLQKFVMDTSGTGTNRHGVIVFSRSSAIILQGSGVRNAGGTGLFVTQNSSAQCNGNIDFSGAGQYGVIASRNSSINASFVNASNAALYGLYVEDCSSISARNANVSNAGVYGVYVFRSSTVFAMQCTGTDCGANAVAQSTEGCGIKVHHGSTASFYNADFSRATHYGVYARHACLVDADTITANNCGVHAINAIYGSNVDAGNSSLTNSGSSAIVADEGSTVCVTSVVATGAGLNAIDCRRGSSVSGFQVNLQSAVEAAIRVSQSGRVAIHEADCRLAGTYAVNCTSTGEARVSSMLYTTGKGVTPAFNTPSSNGAVVWGSGTAS